MMFNINDLFLKSPPAWTKTWNQCIDGLNIYAAVKIMPELLWLDKQMFNGFRLF